jgi:hypothetical protein
VAVVSGATVGAGATDMVVDAGVDSDGAEQPVRIDTADTRQAARMAPPDKRTTRAFMIEGT